MNGLELGADARDALPRVAAIRSATARDKAAVLALLRDSGLTTEGIDECYSDFMLATDARGALVGCVGLEQYGYAALLRSLAVVDARRSRGVGTMLAATMVVTARAYGICDLFLLTETASAFFTRLGFRPCTRLVVPPAVKQSAQFRYACPSSALCMHRQLD